MKSEILGGQAFSYINVSLAPNETIVTESDAMSSMDPQLDLIATFNGGFLKGLLRKLLGGESLFVSRFCNRTDKPCCLVLAPANPGEIRCVELNDTAINLQPGAFIACTKGVQLGLQWAGFASFIAREGLFRINMSGNGKVFYGAYGALLEKDIDGEFIVDSGHLVAYEPSIKLKLQLAGGLFSSFFGGEGLVTRVEGKGKIVLQTRSISGLAAWLNPKL